MAKAIAVTKLGVVGGTVYSVGNYVLEATIADAVVAAGLATVTQADVPDDIDLSTPEAILNAMGDTPSLVIVSASVTTKPSSVNEKDVYIVPAGSAWAALDEAYDNQLALFERGGWKYITPKFGWQVRNKADNGALWYDGDSWEVVSTGGGSGTVTSVALSLPNIFTISGSPVTTSGTLAASLANQAANHIFAGPASGGSSTPGFRALVAADIPDISSVYATKAYADGLVVGLLDDRGNFDASSNTFPAAGGSGSGGAVLKGDLWTISVAGTLGGTAVTPGDIVRALTDTPGQTASNWAVSETNIGYTALNASLNSGQIYVGNGSNVGTARTFSGDVTVSNTGVTAIGAGKVTNAMLAGSIDLTAKVTGVLPFANGGTGLSALGSALQVLRVNAGGTALEFAAAGSGVVIGTTTITSGTNTRVLYNNAGVVGEYTVTGTGNAVLSASPTLTGTVAMAAQTNSGTIVQTSASATAFESGPNGSTNPVFRLVNSVASAATGLSITGNAAGSGVTLTALSSGANEDIKYVTKGTGQHKFSVNTATDGIRLTANGSSGVLEVYGASSLTGRFTAVWGAEIASDREIRWSNSSSSLTTIDTNLSRLAAGTVRVGRGDAASSAGNLIVGATSNSVGSSGFGVFVVGNGTAPTSSPADEFQLYSADSAAGDANAFARNEAGEMNRLTGLSARVSTQFDKTSDTTLANVTGLSRNVEAGRTYAFTAVLYTTSNVAGGVKAAIGGTATATSIIYQAEVLDGSTLATMGTARATSLATTVGDVTAVTAARITITGTIVVNAAGTLVPQFAQNASNGSASSVLVNSSFQLIAVS